MGSAHAHGPAGPAIVPTPPPEKEPYDILSFPAGLIPKLARRHLSCASLNLSHTSYFMHIIFPDLHETIPECLVSKCTSSQDSCKRGLCITALHLANITIYKDIS